jgi:hemoglobin-like flavoprotein
LATIEANMDHAVMEGSLEVVAAAGIDIVPVFFERFHRAIPSQRERFYNRGSAEGLMVNEIIAMLLAHSRGEAWLPTMLRASVNTHHDHGGIELEHYRITFDTLVAVLRDTAGAGWTEDFERAWQGQADQLFALIKRYY